MYFVRAESCGGPRRVLDFINADADAAQRNGKHDTPRHDVRDGFLGLEKTGERLYRDHEHPEFKSDAKTKEHAHEPPHALGDPGSLAAGYPGGQVLGSFASSGESRPNLHCRIGPWADVPGIAAYVVGQPAEELPFKPIQRPATRAHRLDGDLVVKRINVCSRFAHLIGRRAECFSCGAVAIASAVVAARVILEHPKDRLGGVAGKVLLAALLVPLAVSLNRCGHQDLRKRPIIAPKSTV